MINILKGISIALSGKGKQLLLGGAFVILPFCRLCGMGYGSTGY